MSALPTPASAPDDDGGALDAAMHEPRRLGLRAKLNLVIGSLLVLFVAALLWGQIDATRRSVHEEIVAANRVATQLLQRVSFIYQRAGTQGMVEFLNQLGRVRANEITLVDDSGRQLYKSPPATYKMGRDAPDWYNRLVVPPLQRQEIRLPDGRLTVEADPSRAILDGWDDLRILAGAGGAAIVLLLALVFWVVGRTLRPFPAIVGALERMQGGDYATRLPLLPGREAGMIGAAVNRMAAAVQGHLQARLRAYEAERRLSESRDLAHRIEQHMETERREIARELHDELGQSVTAIRSLALSLTQRLGPQDAQGRDAAQLIADEAARLYDAMHGLIPRLTPLALDSLGLVDALADLVDGARQRHAGIEIEFEPVAMHTTLDAAVALAAYRVAQEALNNALRHSGATRIALDARLRDAWLEVQVRDHGRGLPEDWQRPGHYGLLGLRERVLALGGTLEVARHPQGGTLVRASLPLAPTAAASPAAANADAQAHANGATA